MSTARAERRRMMREMQAKNIAKQIEKQREELKTEDKQLRAALAELEGITEQDIDAAYQQGYENGIKQKGLEIIMACYAGICISLHDEFGFGEQRCFRAIEHLDQKIAWALNNTELAEEALAKAGIELDFTDVFDRVQKAGRTQ